MDSSTGIQNEGMSMSKVDCFLFENKGDNHQKWKTINLQHQKEVEKEKRHQASKLGMSTSKVECFFGLKMKAVIVKLK